VQGYGTEFIAASRWHLWQRRLSAQFVPEDSHVIVISVPHKSRDVGVSSAEVRRCVEQFRQVFAPENGADNGRL